jgi:hypothetical protein
MKGFSVEWDIYLYRIPKDKYPCNGGKAEQNQI